MSANLITLFISSVTDEFGKWRNRLHQDLTYDGYVSIVRQEGLPNLGIDTLPALDEHIRQCHAVVHFVGDKTGGVPKREEVPSLLQRHPDLKEKLKLTDEIIATLTRTQWEALLAIYHGRRLLIAVPAKRSASQKSTPQRALQDAHLQRLFQWMKDTVEFDSYETLLKKLNYALHALRNPAHPGYPPADPATLAHLQTLHDRVLADPNPSPLDESALEAIARHVPATLTEYHLRQIAHWSLDVFQIDRHFTPLALRLNLDTENVDRSHDDLRKVLNVLEAKHQPAVVIFGPPGAGKSTLLRRLGYDLAIDALRAPAADARVPFYAELRNFELSTSIASPRAWLARQWRDHGYQRIGDFDDLLKRGQLLLLLDAINEMPCTADEYDSLLGKWSLFLSPNGADHLPAGNQVVFSCRRLDYSIGLQIEKKTIPHVEVESLGPDKIREFLNRYLAGRKDLAGETYATLEAQKTFDLYNSPFYLTLLVALVKAGGKVPRGRASLFSAFVRKAVQRELSTNRLFTRTGPLLSADDYDQVRDAAWNNNHDLPLDSGLFYGLAALAHDMQAHGGAADLARRRVLRIKADAARKLLAADAGSGVTPEDLLKGAVDLHVLERDTRTREVHFRHQLFQEYFAARKLVADLNITTSAASGERADAIAQLARQPWRVSDIQPTVEEELARLRPAERLPMLEPTGWEETLKLAVAMMEDAGPLVHALTETNLALAGLCAAQPEARIGAGLRDELRQKLLARSRDLSADLRARIAAGLALGELGDPRLTPGPLPESGKEDARVLLPPFVTIAAGDYPVGVDIEEIPEEFQRFFKNAAPAQVTIDHAFEIARFPVTNAEWRRFMVADGYNDLRWWQTSEAKKWQAGIATSEADHATWHFFWNLAKTEPERFSAWRLRDPDNENDYRQVMERIAVEQSAFNEFLREKFPDQTFREPAYWRNPAFNSPAQPVVGICWFEALAYCAWLSAESSRSGSTYRYRLPTEIEWEAAARGKEGRIYPWGNIWDPMRCNTVDTRIKSTTPIGVFPHGETLDKPNGVSDLGGHTYDWTSTQYRPNIADINDGREVLDHGRDDSGKPLARVVHGGSWGGSAVFARAAYRSDYVPGLRNDIVGFRVVRVSHP